MVGPADAEGEVGLAARHHFLQRAFKQLASVAEPIVVVTESFHACLACQLSLLLARFGQTEVVEAKVGRNARLLVSTKQRFGFRHVSPLGKTRSPPTVIFGSRVKLRQI